MLFGRIYKKAVVASALLSACSAQLFAAPNLTHDEMGSLRFLVSSGGTEMTRQLSFEKDLQSARSEVIQIEERLSQLLGHGHFSDIQEALVGLDFNRDLELESSEVKTLLGLAAERCNPEMAKAIIDQGADPTIIAHKQGHRASEISQRRASELSDHIKDLTVQRANLSKHQFGTLNELVNVGSKKEINVQSLSISCANADECLELLDGIIKTSTEDRDACEKTALVIRQIERQIDLDRAKNHLDQMKGEMSTLPSKIESLEKELNDINQALAAPDAPATSKE